MTVNTYAGEKCQGCRAGFFGDQAVVVLKLDGEHGHYHRRCAGQAAVDVLEHTRDQRSIDLALVALGIYLDANKLVHGVRKAA